MKKILIALIALNAAVALGQGFSSTQTAVGVTSGRWAFMTAWNLRDGSQQVSTSWRSGSRSWNYRTLYHREWIALFVYDQATARTRELAWHYSQTHVQ